MSEQNKDWFAEWFNSPYYHTLYKHRNYDEAESFISVLIDFLKPSPGARFLDLACGKGRHSVFLNRKGFDVTGLDLAEESIRHAKTFENDRLHFYVHDMRKLFRTNYFDYTLNLFTSFGYFESERDERATIEAVCKGLKPGGTFVLDFFNSEKVIASINNDEKEITVDGITFRISKRVHDSFIIKQIRFNAGGKDHLFEERVKALKQSDFERYFSSCNLKILHLWGNYNLDTFDPQGSDRLIIVARKDE
ncbi:MAG TPA: methyltransferase domain-containing protein [Bacteroidia bacterium]|jgi:SAM-dependent methyltransferase